MSSVVQAATVSGVLLAVGLAHATQGGPRVAEVSQARHTAHIYYNLATGEKVATLIDAESRPAERNAYEVWMSDNYFPCADFGQDASFMGLMDTPACTGCMPSTATGLIYLDWGDVGFDQVIDCVGVAWAADIPDVDADGDGMGDGVPGFGAIWAWFDGDNGFNSSATRQGLVAFGLTDLPANASASPDALPVPFYTATIDLAGSFSSSLAFEIGDTDSASFVAIFNPYAGIDQDGDGLAEFSYAMRFVQPGTFDWDGDGQVDGSVDDQGPTGWPLATGQGTAIDNGDGTWTFEPSAGAPNATGIEDAFDIFTDLDADGVFEPFGTYWYGGFNCSSDPAQFNPYAQFYMGLYGVGDWVCCPMDIYPEAPPGRPGCGYADGVLNFFDVLTFVSWYAADDPRADMYTQDGVGTLNYFDIALFVAAFNAGCP